MSATKLKSRAPNFTKEEQMLLCKVMETFLPIIENKKTDSIRQSQKQEAWGKITEIYNANTKSVPRTHENLLACYRNLKTKMKKQCSEAKMLLKDPIQKEALLATLEENGNNWELISQDINQTVEICQQSYEELGKELKKMETNHKKVVMGTGGGPPPDDDDAMTRLKKLISPQIDGLYTIYDGDAALMQQFQESQPEETRVMPIENIDKLPPRIEDSVMTPEPMKIEENKKCIEVHEFGTPKMQYGRRPLINRTDILRKKKDASLNFEDDDNEAGPSCSKKKKNSTNESFLRLSEAKLELVALQKKSLEMELSHKKKMQELELENTILYNEHQKLIREKELLLMDLKIKKESA